MISYDIHLSTYETPCVMYCVEYSLKWFWTHKSRLPAALENLCFATQVFDIKVPLFILFSSYHSFHIVLKMSYIKTKYHIMINCFS